MREFTQRRTMCIAVVTMMAVIVRMVSTAHSQGSSTLSASDSMDPQNEIITSRTHAKTEFQDARTLRRSSVTRVVPVAYLSCESGEMVVKINFTDPFRGIIYAHLSRDSPCRILGNDSTYYELKIPLKKCGTWQKSPRVFVNNVTIRFHPALELEEDETKTIVCRYPPPLTPSPGGIIVAPVTLSPGGSTPVNTVSISEVEILSIICVILFLSLLTLGLGTSYVCLKRRNIRLVRRSKTSSSGPGSEITKLSGTTTLGNFSIFEPIRIPRVVPYSACGGSEAAILTSARTSAESGSGPSDYPPSDSSPSTESPDIIDEVDESQVHTSAKRFYDNYGFQEHSGPVFTIPKAILRKDTKGYVQPMHGDTAVSISLGPSLQDQEYQSVITTLELEDINHSVWNSRYATVGAISSPETSENVKETRTPVYAQVRKKPRVRIMEGVEVLNDRVRNISTPDKVSPPGVSRKLEDMPDAHGQKGYDILNENKPPSIASSFFLQQANDRTFRTPPILPTTKNKINHSFRNEVNTSSALHERRVRNIPEYRLGYVASQITPIPEEEVCLGTPQGEASQDDSTPKVSVKDIDDVYVTTTVETESREMVTTVSRDVLEKHVKTPTKWNVIIRQRDQPASVSQNIAYLDSTAKGEMERTAIAEDRTTSINSTSVPSAQNFKVTIRAIPPKDQQHVSLQRSALKSQLQMDQIYAGSQAERSRVSEDLTTRTPSADISEEYRSDYTDRQAILRLDDAFSISDNTLIEGAVKSRERSSWDENMTSTPDVLDTTSFTSTSDSLHSEHSLGERSTSEVIEAAPTVRRNSSDIPMLERSTSEILTTPENFGRWSRVPVFENFSPEFLAAIPVLLPEQRESNVFSQPFRPIVQIPSAKSKGPIQETETKR